MRYIYEKGDRVRFSISPDDPRLTKETQEIVRNNSGRIFTVKNVLTVGLPVWHIGYLLDGIPKYHWYGDALESVPFTKEELSERIRKKEEELETAYNFLKEHPDWEQKQEVIGNLRQSLQVLYKQQEEVLTVKEITARIRQNEADLGKAKKYRAEHPEWVLGDDVIANLEEGLCMLKEKLQKKQAEAE